jgi:hypothetical protein
MLSDFFLSKLSITFCHIRATLQFQPPVFDVIMKMRSPARMGGANFVQRSNEDEKKHQNAGSGSELHHGPGTHARGPG